jgi:hypothetical protein
MPAACPIEDVRPLPLADGVSKPLVSPVAAMLVDERGASGTVPHAVHQLAEASALVIVELVARVPEVVEVEAGQARLSCSGVSLAREVAAPELRALRTREDEGRRARSGEGV